MRLEHPEITVVGIFRDEYIEQRCSVLELVLPKHAARESESPFEIVWLQQERIAVRSFGWLEVLFPCVTEREKSVGVCISATEFNHSRECFDRCRIITVAHRDEANVAPRAAEGGELLHCRLVVLHRFDKPILLKADAAKCEVERGGALWRDHFDQALLSLRQIAFHQWSNLFEKCNLLPRHAWLNVGIDAVATDERLLKRRIVPDRRDTRIRSRHRFQLKHDGGA